MRCPNPICRAVFVVRDEASTAAQAPEIYPFEKPKPAESNKPSMAGSWSEVVPVLEAFTPNQAALEKTDQAQPKSSAGETPPEPHM